MKVYHLMGKAPYFTNCYLITDNSGNAVLFDCSIPWQKIEPLLKNDTATLRAVFMTHGHPDHCECLQEVCEKTNVPIYMGQGDISLFNVDCATPLDNRVRLEFGEIKVFAFHTPGHTPGGICYKIDDMLITGDTLFAGTVGRTDLEGGDYPTLMQSLKVIVNVLNNQDVKIMPGHSHFSTFSKEKVQNPYLREVL